MSQKSVGRIIMFELVMKLRFLHIDSRWPIQNWPQILSNQSNINLFPTI